MTSITAELIDAYRVDITNGVHTWRADEPVELGGDNTGPNPYDLLLGSLAACTSITLSMYAKRKGIDMTSLSVEYTYNKIHADDCDKCDDSHSGMIDHVTSRIFIDGNFDEATRNRLIDIAQRCPVHKTLEKGIVFDETVFAG
ncbi:MAG: OsmC family protein [Acidimicrobiales bacterium]